MVTRRGLLSGAALAGAGALVGVARGTGVAEAAQPLNTPFTPVSVPHLVQAEQMVQYQRMLAAGQLTEGLAGHWPLDGTATDRADSAHTLTRGAGTAWTKLRAGGELGFDGTANAYSATTSVLDTTKPFTVSAWVRLAEGVPLDNIFTAVSQDGAQTSRFLLMYQDTPGAWVFRVRSANQAARAEVVATTAPVPGRWTHLAGVWDNGTLRIYVDGRREGSVTDTSTTAWAADQGFNIGRAKWDGAPVNRWNGSISDVRAFARALSDQDVDLISGQAAKRNNVYLIGEEAEVVWGDPGDPAGWVNRSRCNSFTTAVLRHTYKWAENGSYFTQWFGTDHPTAARYQSRFAGNDGGAGPHFKAVTKVTDLQPGDLVSVNYQGTVDGNTGHIVMVREVKGVRTGWMDQADRTQYVVEVIDCTASPHGVYGTATYEPYPDTRMVDNLPDTETLNRAGAGIGHMVFYAKADGSFGGHRWSVNSGTWHPETEHAITAGRVV
ncbi:MULTISPECIES: LamG domain-containing protein [unclassified Kitasatospora]|uniref:LamG domain-containing protein n=1 Tax=unclassified Kitasatospora TaxID=2633591 RepID=UPI00070B636B|nr:MULTISPECIES: LamG domain-containing protein [unclassified Kitasatospora]KQV12082.1 Tat pathway signal protein [Kitasatospora sp. Root107]KRB72622.1 Tat pathway signal protein [Kitasatospora sp. Root187]